MILNRLLLAAAVVTQDRFEAAAGGKVDLLHGSGTVTLSRREIVSFSLPTFLTGVSAVLRAVEPGFPKEVFAGRRPTASSRTLFLLSSLPE